MINRRNLLKNFSAASLLPMFPGLIGSSLAATGDVIRFAIAKPAGDLDPHAYNGLWGVQGLVFEPLISYGKDGVLEPALASAWELSADGRALKLELRQGVTFHDGAPWNAEAMKWNLDRWIFVEDHGWMNHVRLFDRLEVVDDYNVVMHFKEAPLSLLFELTYTRPVRYLSPNSVGTDGVYAEPVGTGPWRQLSADDTGSSFAVFDGYWGEKPLFETLELKVLPDSRGRMAALRAGEIDVTGGDFFASMTAIEAQTLIDAGFSVDVGSGIGMLMGMNPDRAPSLSDARVRKAISHGFDRAAIAQVLYKGLAQPAGSMFPLSVPLSGTQFEVDQRDVEAAKALLEDAGWTGDGVRQKDGNSLTLELVISEEQIAGSRSMAEVLQAQLGEIGVGLTIRSVDHASRHSDIPARKYDLAFFLTFGAPYEPFGTMVGYLMSTYDNGVDGKVVVDPENLDPLMAKAMAASQDDVQAALQDVFDWMHETTAFIPMLYTPTLWAHTDRVTGFTPPATEYDTPFQGLSVRQG